MSDGKQELIHLLETIADNKFVLGDKLVDIGISGPELEATHASIALAQSELGHARHLYNWAFELQGKGINKDIAEQSGKAFTTILEIKDWFSLIANLFVFNQAVHFIIEKVLELKHFQVETRASKLLKELREPIVFARQWSHRLLEDEGRIPQMFIESFAEAVKATETWLRKIDQASWMDTGIGEENILNRFRKEMNSVMDVRLEDFDVQRI